MASCLLHLICDIHTSMNFMALEAFLLLPKWPQAVPMLYVRLSE